ncbi:HNH endonuclease [Plesiomonas shigelloides]|uniref:HNH endonuclease n=1 Tax=Plesiomonas shigelloides TaxID=703 RepID=UPI001261AD35|nr:HNH endonuclease [Plesiomonas shigelloides]KAB7660143.1 hypothetical protein GBN14_03605 [Plesiomonas shigelloides]
MTFSGFVEYLKENSGLAFETTSQKVLFTMRFDSDSDRVYFTPHSTMDERYSKLDVVKNVFIKQKITTSFQPSQYKEMTVNASYILSLIFHYLVDEKGAEIYATLDDTKALEGYQLDSQLLQTKRDRKIVKKAKERDDHTCQACGYKQQVNGSFVIDCHHINPLGSTGEIITKLEDLVCLCPNCHRVAHLKNPPYGIEKIKSIVNS